MLRSKIDIINTGLQIELLVYWKSFIFMFMLCLILEILWLLILHMGYEIWCFSGCLLGPFCLYSYWWIYFGWESLYKFAHHLIPWSHFCWSCRAWYVGFWCYAWYDWSILVIILLIVEPKWLSFNFLMSPSKIGNEVILCLRASFFLLLKLERWFLRVAYII